MIIVVFRNDNVCERLYLDEVESMLHVVVGSTL